MPAPTQPTPSLQLPTNLVSHPLAAATAAVDGQRAGTLPTLASSSFRHSQTAVGAAYKLSSDGRPVRRLKGVLPVAIKGQSVSLINPLTQTPVQSFTLSPSDQPCTAPLVILRPRSANKTLRTTYFGVRAKEASAGPASASASASAARGLHGRTRTEVWAFTEELSAKGKGTADGAIRKEVALVGGSVCLLHALCNGRLVATLDDGSLAILTHELARVQDRAGSASSHSFKATQSFKVPSNEARVQIHVSLLDPVASQSLVASTSRIEEGTLQGLRIALTSAATAGRTSSSAAGPKKSKKKGRKTTIEVIDEAEGHLTPSGIVPSGEVTLAVSALLRPVDEVADARLRELPLGSLSLGQVGDAGDLLDLQVYGDGRLVALTCKGELVTAKISLATGRPSISQWRRMQIANLTQSSSGTFPAAVLPLSKDHVLLVAIPKNKGTADGAGKAHKERVVALLFDLEVEAVLSQVDWAVSLGSQGRHGDPPSISLSRAAGSLAIIQLDPPHGAAASSADESAQARMNLLALPFVVPDYSVLRHAMGKGELTRMWTAGGSEAGAVATAATLQGVDVTSTFSSGHALRARSDWSEIMHAVRNVPDISETELVLLLIEVLRNDKRRLIAAASAHEEADGSKTVRGKPPTAIEFLADFVRVSVSRPLLRSTLKARINDVDDIAVLLQVLRLWLDAAARMPLECRAKLPGMVPSIDLILPFATDLLDTYVPLLISTPSTHGLLRSLSKTIQLHLSTLNSLITLGAPLSAFAKLEEEQKFENMRIAAAAARAGSAQVGPGGAAASAGNARVAAGGKGSAAARAETGGGLGIGLGTEGVQKTRRAEAREESMLVGAYSLEKLEI